MFDMIPIPVGVSQCGNDLCKNEDAEQLTQHLCSPASEQCRVTCLPRSGHWNSPGELG